MPRSDPDHAAFADQSWDMKRIWDQYGPFLLLLAAILFMATPALFAFAE